MTVIDLASRREAREWDRRRAEIEDLRWHLFMLDGPEFKRGSYRKSYKPRGQNTILIRMNVTRMGIFSAGPYGWLHLCEAGMRMAGERIARGERKT